MVRTQSSTTEKTGAHFNGPAHPLITAAFFNVLQEKTMFTIPWKHAARHGWDLEKDACLFQKWAIHTGELGS